MSSERAARRPLRICYVTGSLALGGSERQMVLLAKHLPRDRFQVEFLLLGQPGDFADEARATGARVHALHGPSRSGVPALVWAARVSVAIWSFVRFARRRRYDVMDAWLFSSYALAAVTRWFTGVPVLIAGRRSLSDFKEQFSFPQRIADRVARRAADAIVANADAVAEDVCRREGLAPERVRVIRNAVEILPSPTPDELREMRAAWGVADDAVVIGSVANYKPGKGIELLIDAFGEVARMRPSTHLVLVGEGSLRAPLEARVASLGLDDRVTLAGATVEPRRLYHAFDISVLASETEGLPNVLLEAAAAERPLIATDAGASREIVIDRETGILTPIGDRDAMVAALGELVDDPALRRTLGAAALRRAASEFSVEKSVADFAALYEELSVRKGRAART